MSKAHHWSLESVIADGRASDKSHELERPILEDTKRQRAEQLFVAKEELLPKIKDVRESADPTQWSPLQEPPEQIVRVLGRTEQHQRDNHALHYEVERDLDVNQCCVHC